MLRGKGTLDDPLYTTELEFMDVDVMNFVDENTRCVTLILKDTATDDLRAFSMTIDDFRSMAANGLAALEEEEE